MSDQEREALKRAREAWRAVTGKWPRKDALDAAVRAALAAREEPQTGVEVREAAVGFAEDIAALANDETRRRSTSLSALIVQAQHVVRLAAAAREEPRSELASESERRSAREKETSLDASKMRHAERPKRTVLEFTRHEIETLLATGNLHYQTVDIFVQDTERPAVIPGDHPETRKLAEMLREDTERPDEQFAVGDKVRYQSKVSDQSYPGTVREVQRDGAVLIEWSCPPPQPFFHGPYQPDEIVRDTEQEPEHG